MRALATTMLVLSLSAQPASAQSAPQLDPYLILMQETLRFEADDVRIASEVRRGEAIVSMGVTHLRTGVLQNELRRNNALVSVIRAGVPGFYAGRFASDQTIPGEMWCFARNAENLEAGARCIVSSGPLLWREAGDPTNPYFPVAAEVNPLAPPLPIPEIAEQPVQVHPDLRAAYIFRGWGDDYVDVQLQLGGRPIMAVGMSRRIRLESDGSALLAIPNGLIRIERASRRSARVSLVEPPTAP